ncbi:hypothetical protein [Hyphomicrobium denitrificans]|uniref:hypothetical protein n=1 Tax=Hyphomicrobium denitrificans TaxID=53399 RepID=UPI00022E52F3
MTWDENFNGWMWAIIKGSEYNWMPISVIGNIYENPILFRKISSLKDFLNISKL